MAGPEKRHPKWLDAAFVALWALVFCSGLGFKASARFLGWPRWGEHATRENRRLADFPDLKALPAKEWGKAVDGWYGDQFAWRSVLLEAHRTVHLQWLKTAMGGQVPGRGGWVFRKGGDWAETEDYLGALELTPEELSGWRVQLEGRVAWAEAHEMGYVEVITPVKARIHPEKMMPWFAAHRGTNMADQVRGALEGSPARDHVVFFEDEARAGTAAGEELFYRDDHHLNARGTYLLYGAVRRAVERERGRELPPMPPWFGDAPPGEVEREEAEGCFERDGRLCVREPGQHEARTGLFGALKAPGGVGPARSRRIVNDEAQDGAARVILAHDSFLRFPLSSWHFEKDRVRFPLGRGFRDIYSVMWGRYNTDRLGVLAGLGPEERPDVLVEQFPDIKLNFGVNPDETMRRAAAWGRGRGADAEALVPGTPVVARLRWRGVAAPMQARLVDGSGRAVGEWTVPPGVLRACFSDAFPWPEGGVRVECDGDGAGGPEAELAVRMIP